VGAFLFKGDDMQVNKLMYQVRFKAGDTAEARYSDYEVLLALNEANRIFRNACMDEAPEIITRELNGELDAGECEIPMGTEFIRIFEMRVDDRLVLPIERRTIKTLPAEGMPKGYRWIRDEDGELSLWLYPKPNKKVTYSMEVAYSVQELTADSDMDFPNECLKCIVDLAVNALTTRSAEISANINEALRGILRNLVPFEACVKPY
jgi:hypothetical protein